MSSDSQALVPGLASGAALDKAVRACTENLSGGEAVAALARVIKAAVAADQRSAIHVADQAANYVASLRSGYSRAMGLINIVAVLSPIAPDLAGQVADVAEALIATFGGPNARASAQCALVRALAAGDPHRAERLADGIGTTEDRASALAALARQAVAADPQRAAMLADRAEAAANEGAGGGERAFAHCAILRDLAVVDRERALSVADRAADRAACAAAGIESPNLKAKGKVQFLVAMRVAAVDRERAERIAAQIADEGYRRLAQWELQRQPR